ncbi:hypothetical protein M501DRAFT_936539 [Patellaria atrata CBS 101060]|uniref:Uncharacterized protein n=1 Tax=Patellaria atrata CBS 101060 TaxID=1346257 RepID=A0A9P4SAD4_9PEZI|nr:hypothetical protein M501DRAFT_936539 [Patellaria atrata CBS 101060]
MKLRVPIKCLLQAPKSCVHPIYPLLTYSSYRTLATSPRTLETASSLPRILQPATWQAIIPRPLRKIPSRISKSASAKRPWNPATVWIIYGLLIGSQAINTIAVKDANMKMSRKAEAKLALLREVVERVQKGEEVDVRGLLGTGLQEEEKEWEEVLREIEEEDALWRARERPKRNEVVNDLGVKEGQILDGDETKISVMEKDMRFKDIRSTPRPAEDRNIPRGFY